MNITNNTLSFLNDSIEASGYSGPQSWIYYLAGAICFVFLLVTLYFIYRWKDGNIENENMLDTYGQFKRFWIKNRFLIMILIFVVLLLCGIMFMAMNSIIVK